jgi:hypothetical protein
MNTGSRLAKNLSVRGNAVCGVGCYSAVIEKRDTDETVLKIGTTLDDPWLGYYQDVIVPLKGNPFLPKINHVREFFDCEDGYYIADMETLRPTVNTDLSDLCKEYVCGKVCSSELLSMCALREVENPDKLLSLLDKIIEQTDCFSYEDAEETLANISFEDSKFYRMIDLHDSNFMEREDGTLVIIDPWCNIDMSEVESLDSWWDEQRHG